LQLLVVSLVVARLDYGNATLAELSDNQLSRLQFLLNAAARLGFLSEKVRGRQSYAPRPKRIEFKLAVLTYGCLHLTALPYLVDELYRVADIDSRRRLRSASTSTLVVPPMRHSTIVGGWPWPILGAIRAVATAGEPGKNFVSFVR